MSAAIAQTVSSYPERDSLDPLLSNYYRDVGTLPVLQAQQEFAFAERIERLELQLWAHLLGHPDLLDPVLQVVTPRLEQGRELLSRLRRACGRYRRAATPAVTKRYAKCCQETAVAVRRVDVDREALDQLLAHLRLLVQGEVDTLFSGAKDNAPDELLLDYVSRALELGRLSQQARNDFVQANLRLVVTIARRFDFKQIPLNDLIQEGNIGLIKAVGRFDYQRGYRFSTYASWWIRHAITRAMADKGRLVRVPVHMLSTVHKVTRVSRELSSQLGREPTTQEIASSSAIGADKVTQVLGHLPSRSLSLNNKVNDEDDRRFIELVVDEDSRSPVETLGDQQVLAHVREIFRDLQPMEKDILQRRFGLEGEEEHTLVEIGGSYELSRERIRQIQERALGKIRRALMRRNAV